MLLNLDPDIVRSAPRLHSTCSKHNRNYSAILATLQITSYALGV